MAYDEKGFLPLRYNEALQLIEDTQRELLEVPLTYADNKIGYQINACYARVYDLLAQGVEEAFSNLSLGSAEGPLLEEIGRLRNVFRIKESRSSTSSFKVTGKPNTVLQNGTLFGSNTITEQVFNPTTITIDPLSCIEASVKTTQVVVGATYGVQVNGIPFSYVVQSGDTVEDIHTDLVSQIEATPSITYTVTDTVEGNGRALLFVADSGTTVAVASTSTKMVVDTVKVLSFVQAVNLGPIPIPAGFINKVLTPVSGVSEVINLGDFSLGREREEDFEFRNRVAAGSIGDSTGTYPSIQQALLTNVPNVTLVRIFENTNEFPTDADGRPRGSYEVLVDGGATDIDIAQEIWRTKPCSMEVVGSVVVPITDSTGKPRIVKFSRPTAVPIEVNITYVLYDELVFPDDGVSVMRQIVIDTINALPLGRDVFANSLYGPIYAEVSGMRITNIEIRKTGVGSFTNEDIPISPDEFASGVIADVNIGIA